MNFQDVIRRVYDEQNNRLNTSGGGNTTIFAVVNTAAAGQASVALDSSGAFIGLVTVANTVPVTGTFYQTTQPVSFGNVSISSNVAWADPKTYIGLVTVANTVPVTGTFYQSTQPVSFGNVTLSPSANYIGLTTTTISNPTLYAVVNTGVTEDSVKNIGFATVAISNPTLYAVVNTNTSNSNVTLNPSSAFIGLVTVANTVPVTWAGNVTIQDGGGSITVDGNVGILGNITLSNPNNFIGLVTAVPSTTSRSIVGNLTLSNSNGFIGLVTAYVSSAAIRGNITLSNSNGFIGLVTVVQSSAVRSIAGNLTLANSNNFIGLVTVGNVVSTTWSGNVTLANANGFIGLATTVNGAGTQFIGLVTSWVSSFPQLSFYQQASLISGYKYYGNAAPGSNPTTAVFKIQRETLNTGEVLFGGGVPTFVHQWSSASLASLTYL